MQLPSQNRWGPATQIGLWGILCCMHDGIVGGECSSISLLLKFCPPSFKACKPKNDSLTHLSPLMNFIVLPIFEAPHTINPGKLPKTSLPQPRITIAIRMWSSEPKAKLVCPYGKISNLSPKSVLATTRKP